MLRLHGLRKERQDGRIRLSCEIDTDAGRRSLWFSLPLSLADQVRDDVFDPFVIALLYEGSQTGGEMVVEGKISERLHYNVAHGYAYILSRLTTSGKRIEIRPREIGIDKGSEDAGHVAAGFSAGIDSFQTYIDHNLNPVTPSTRISHVVMNNVGSHGGRDQSDAVFARRLENVGRFAEEMGIRLVDIDSNLADFYRETPFQLTHTLRNVAAITVLQGYIGKFLYSSSFKYEECFVGPTYDIAYSEPCGLHLLSTDRLSCISSGSQYSRLEKTINVSSFEPSYRYLDICVDPTRSEDGTNCSCCWKCSRALVTFEALGVLERYRPVFDLAVFRRHRDRYIATTLRDMSKKNPNDADVVRFMRDRLLNPPSAAKILALRSKQKLTALRR